MEPFLGQISMFGGNFAPRGWAFCNGQLLPIASNSALFSLFGTMYGGDGRTTFGLPDLRGRVPLHAGRGPGLADRRLGQKGGAERVTLNATQVPAHSHAARGNSGEANQAAPTDNTLSMGEHFINADPNVNMRSSTTNTGGGQPFDNLKPYLVVNYIVALQGLYPSRN